MKNIIKCVLLLIILILILYYLQKKSIYNEGFENNTEHIYVNDIKDIVNFRYNPQRFKKKGFTKYPDNTDLNILDEPPKIYEFFKIVIWNNDIKYINNKNKNVFCDVNSIKWLYDNIEKIGKHPILVVMGDDMNLSKCKDKINVLQSYFDKIYWEGKDIYHNKIESLPMGLIMYYNLRNGGNEHILKYINRSNNKNKLITTAFGSQWPKLDNILRHRKSLISFIEKTDFIERQNWKPIKYYEELSKYKYFICPPGNGIQAPKLFECYLVQTVPVVIRDPAHEDLKNRGYPMLMVGKWEDINLNLLIHKYDTQYKYINWKDVIYSITNKGIVEKYKLN